MKQFVLLSLAVLGLTACSTAAASPSVPTSPANLPKPLNIAHRGARSLAPENTLAAARKAYEAGADMWELDVAVTADGQLVVLHDDTLERTSNVKQVYPERRPWAVNDFTLDELHGLDFGSWFNQTDPFKQIQAGAVSEQDRQSYVGEKIPTLEEALTFTRDNHWRVNVEIKDATGTPGDAFVVQKTIDLIHTLGMTDSVIISSFNHAYLAQTRALDPEIKTAVLVEGRESDPVALLDQYGAQGFNPNVKNTSPQQVAGLVQAGKEVYVWTVNDPGDIRALAQAGVTGIITDFPQELEKALAQNQ